MYCMQITEPPSYEKSINSTEMQNQILNSMPSLFEKKTIFNFIGNDQHSDKKIVPLSNEHVSTEVPEENEKTTGAQAEPLNYRLERVSSYIQQMIDTAQISLTTSTPEVTNDDDSGNDSNTLANVDDVLELQQRQISKRASIERLRSSQTSLARTLDQLNLSIIHSIIDAATSNLPTYTQEMDNISDKEDSNISISHHHHYHHHHHHHSNRGRNHQRRRADSSSSKKQRQVPDYSSIRSTISLWTNLLTQTALVFCICHCVLSWTKLTSSVISTAWLVSLLRIKTRIGYCKKPSSASTPLSLFSPVYTNFKSSLVPRIYLVILALFGHH
ncbi:hypothetical protein BCR42DRAFT_411450 [Absidia repens]|uniref:Uncharacterized protein n=1 Tax=Absidia repens TaxID=90262 RepID=A0A1X2ILR8_9FUNG|nr:hypothetical protein BCR42DRAFT_411450 [Absidia repens]